MPNSGNSRRFVAALAAWLVVPVLADSGWSPYRFRENERYEYRLKWTQEGKTSTGHYVLQIRPAGDGRLTVEVDGRLGESECKASVTVDSAEAVPQQMMMSCMMMAPAIVLFWGPVAGYWTGRELTDDDRWSYSHGDESMSFRVEGDCTHAGQTGKRAVMRHNGQVRLTSCVVMGLALPAAVALHEENGESIEATLQKYSK